MASFSESNFVKKLADLNNSQQSIQTLSLWLIHHRKHSKAIVHVWMKELKKVRPSKKLTLLYLANDVIQNSKKKGPEFNKSFRSALPEAYRHAMKEADDKMKASMERMLNIWKERGVFDANFVVHVRKHLSDPPEKKPPKVEPVKKKKKVELTLREEIEVEIAKEPTREAPEADDLIAHLKELENVASTDAAVRERIAALPPEVSDVSLLENLKDKVAADKLTETVDEACSLLSDYNSRLSAELQNRRDVARMLKEYILTQKAIQGETEKKLAEYKVKLENVSSVRRELKSHIQSLPDLTLLPDVTGGLAPLPSAGDLFSIGS